MSLQPFHILLLGWFIVDMGTFIISPVIGPVVREMGFSEFQASLVLAMSAFMVAAGSPFWGRRTDTWGRRLVFIVALVGVAIGSALFGLVTQLGLAGVFSLPLLLTLLVTSRLLSSLTKPGVWPPAMAYVADTYRGAERTVKMGLINAATSLGMVLGPAVVAMTAGLGLVAPFYLAAALPLLPAGLAWWRLTDNKRATMSETDSPLRLSDERIWPYLVIGFIITLVWSLINMNAGFYFQDRLTLSTQRTAQLTGIAFAAFGIAMLVAQLGVVRWSIWTPVRLLVTALVLLITGFFVWYIASSFVTMTLTMLVMGCGIGLGVTGFFAAPTLVVEEREQGALAGLINGSYGLAFAVGPLIGAALYEIDTTYPIVLAIALLALGLLLSGVTPQMRASRQHPLST